MAKLWGKEISVDEQISLLEDFSSYLEVSMLVTIEKFKSIIRLQKPGWLNVARDFLTDTLPEVCDDIGQYLVKSKLMNPPNWKIFLKDRLEIAKEAGQSIYSYHEKCFQICASQYQQQYQATYEQELAKQEGLGFGIISSSLASHLVYAAQSARKEVENEKKASEAADKIMQSSLGPIEKAAQMTIAFYNEKFDPFVNDFIISFYSDIEKLIYDGLEVYKESLDNNKTLSNNELSGITEDNHRERITASLSIYPFNGDALFWAIRYDDADDDFIQFCSSNTILIHKYLVAIEQSAVSYLKKQKEKADLYNRDPLTEDIIQLLHRIKSFLTDERMYGTSTYDDIIQKVYGERIDPVCHKFDTLVKIKKTPSALLNYAKNNSSITITQNDFKTLVKYNAIFETSKIKEVFDVISDDYDAFEKMLSDLCKTIQSENAKYQEAERQRKQRERELAEQKQREEEQRKAEEQQRKDELLRIKRDKFAKKVKKIALITTPILVTLIAFIVTLNTRIIPSNNYEKGVELFNKGEYFEASCYLFKAKGYSDAEDYLIKLHRTTIVAGGTHTVGLKKDGTVVAVGDNEKGQCNVSKWSNIVSIAAGYDHTVGLRADGTVVAVGDNSDGQCNVSAWKDVVMITTGDDNTIALTSKGKILVAGDSSCYGDDYTKWTNIVDVAASDYHMVGLKSDGTVVACGWSDVYYRESDVSKWSNVVSVDADSRRSIGIKADGTLVSTKKNSDGENNISNWNNVVQVYVTYWDTIALKADGSIMVTGEYSTDDDYSNWKNIVAISISSFCRVGLKSDGTVISVGSDWHGRDNVGTWKDIDTDIIYIRGK